ncbi:protein sidekick isoform X2 [Dermacentor albipictus]|uniref:protein sidekick isoform X2 n=1 Tax=Dermacentor albipictus TaxID=60249 RepID=UPI0031FD57C3
MSEDAPHLQSTVETQSEARRDGNGTSTMFCSGICLFLCTLLCALGTGIAENDHQQLLSPRFLTQPSGGYVGLGEKRALRCEAVGAPPPRLQLLKDDHPLTNWTSLRLVHVLSSIGLSQAGAYQCLAKNAAGAVLSAKAKLQVAHLTPTEEISEAVQVAVRKGGHVILEPPVVDSVPPATATWAFGSVSLDSRQFATTQDNRLVILEATPELGGRYQVELTNPHTGDTIFGPPVELSVDDSDGEYKAELSIVVPPIDREFNNLENGYDSYLECIAAGSPLEQVQIVWLKDDRPLGELPHVLTHWNRTLTLLHLGPQHAGRYTCQASLFQHFDGSVTEPTMPIIAHANVTVSVPPSLSRKVDEETAVELGQQVQLPCAAEGHPLPEVHWLLDAQPLDLTSGRFHVHEGGTLEIRALAMEDAGVYQCVAENLLGEARAATWLHVKISPPAFLRAPENVTVLDGMDAQLSCSVVGAPLPNTSWAYSDVVPVHSEGRMQILESGTLVIASVVLADSGKYTCMRANSAGSASAEAYLTVLVRTQIVKPPVDTRVILGSTAELQCRISHDLSVPYQVTWFFEEKPLASSSRTHLAPDGTLKIDQARNTDIGTYTCVVTSPGGNDTRSAKLEVIELPHPPGHVKALVTDTMPKTVNVTWSPAFDGHSPITHYVLQMRALPTEDMFWLTVDSLAPWTTALSNISAEATSILVSQLKPSVSYQFRVSAVNGVGEGSPGGPTEPVSVPPEPPGGPPQNVVGAPRSATSVMLQWQPPLEGERNGRLLGYVVRFRLAGYSSSAWSMQNVTTTRTLLEDLIVWQNYAIEVAAYNEKGLGVFSPSILVRTLEGVPQAAPTAVRADALNSTAVRVRWLPPDPQRVNGINQGYRVEAWLRGREVGLSPPDATALVAPNVGSPTTEHMAVITGLRKYHMYNVTVLCFTSPGNGPRSKPVLVTTKQDVPGPVKSLKFDDILDVSVRVLWTPPEESNGNLLGYTLRYWIKDDLGSAVLRNLTADETETTVRGLRPVTWYTIEVFAWTVIGAGPSIEASIKSGIPPVLPTAPRRLAVSNIGPFSVMLQFTPGFDGNTSITRWIVEAQTRRSEQWIPVHETSAPGARTLHVSPLVPFTEYRLRLMATNVVGPSPPSEPSQWFQTIQAPPAHPPRNVTVRAVNAHALRVRWTPLPQVDWYGVPRGYNVSFRAKDEPDFKWTVVEDHNANSVVLDNLQAFTPYEVFMVAFNDVGASSASAISSERTREAAPSAGPSQVTAKATSSTTVVVSWGPVPRTHRSGVLEGYRVVYQAARESAPMRKHIESNATFTTTLTELRKYTAYSVQVLAYTRVGDGALSLPPISVTTFEDVPGPPSNVSFPDVTTTTARIIWDVPQEPNGEILGYKISFWRRPNSGNGAAENEDTAESADKGRVSREVSAMDRTLKAFDLQPQSYYEFAVSARTQEGWGVEARALVLTTASREKPQAPSRPLVSPSQVQARHVTLSWTPGRDGFAPLRCYLLQQIENTGPWKELSQKLDPSTTTYTVAGLKPATRYLFRLRAVNDLGFSPWSEPSNETWTLPAAPQVAPTNVIVTPYTTTSITVVWKGLTDEAWNGDKRHPGYRVEACPVGAPLQDCRVRSLDGLEGGPLTLEGLQRDRIYEVRVIAYNGQGDGPPTRPVSVYVGEAVPTGSPRQLQLNSPSSTEITVSWAPPAESERNGELLGYKIFYKAEGDAEEAMEAVPATPTAYTITDLRRFTKYSVQLLAFNPAGDGPRSQLLQVHTQADRPGPPGSLVFTDITMNSLNVSWTPPEEPNGIITGYLVNYETADLDIESGRQVRQKVVHTFLAVRGLDEMTTYRFTVRAETSQGYGAESQCNVTTGPQEGSPLAPLELALQRSATAATLSWKEGPPGASIITGYLVEARPSHAGEDEEWQTVAELDGSPRTSYEVSFQNLLPSTDYTLRLFARNRLGISPPAYAPDHVLTPNKLFLEYKQRLPFYREPWFLVVLAAASMVAIILVVAVLCVKSKTHQYKQEMQQSLRSDDQLSLNDQQAAGFGSPEPPTKRTMTRGSLRKPLPALRSPPRPSPASVTYSDEEDTKAYDDHCDSSSLTEKPSEISSSESQGSDSEDDTKGDPHSFVNHYANVNDTLRQSWKRQRIAKPPSYTDSEQESSAAMCLNGGRVVLNNMAGSRAPLPGFSSFV